MCLASTTKCRRYLLIKQSILHSTIQERHYVLATNQAGELFMLILLLLLAWLLGHLPLAFALALATMSCQIASPDSLQSQKRG